MSAPPLVRPASSELTATPVVGIQGEAACFSDAALRLKIPGPSDARYFRTFAAALDALSDGTVDRVLLPVHNSIVGVVTESLSAIASHDVRVVRECTHEILLVLAGLEGAELSGIRAVRSHPVALRQCRRLFEHHADMTPVATDDTAGAAREVAEAAERHIAAITTREAAMLHGLTILQEPVQDRARNSTHFWLLARRELRPRSELARIAQVVADRNVSAVRGATTIGSDIREELTDATRELLVELLARNAVQPTHIVSAVFTVTPDIRSGFPAEAARELPGWERIPLLCAQEVAVPDALPLCIRVLLHVEQGGHRRDLEPAYLRDAAGLRPDL